jgi:hypothetical protein
MDETEQIRRKMVHDINSKVQSDDKDLERKRLEEQYGKVWSTSQIQDDFLVIGFAAPFVVVKRISDGKKGTLEFQHSPRFYFNFQEE